MIMQAEDKLIRVTFIAALISLAALLTSGTFVLVNKIQDNSSLHQQITLSSKEQIENIVFPSKEILPGEEIKYDLTVSSKLIEMVNYEISFSDHQNSEEDKYFYVSVSNDKKEPLVNNTLSEIFENDIKFNRKLDSNESELLYFTFSLSSQFSGSGSFEFDICLNASGRIFN